MPPRLRRPVRFAEFVNVKITAARPAFERRDASPHETVAIIGEFLPSLGNLFHDPFEQAHLFAAEFELSIRVVDQQDSRCKSHLACERDYFLDFRRRSCTNYATDHDLKARMLS